MDDCDAKEVKEENELVSTSESGVCGEIGVVEMGVSGNELNMV